MGVKTSNGSFRFPNGYCEVHDGRMRRRGVLTLLKDEPDYVKRTEHPLYLTYNAIKNRCYNARTEDYKWYGARGIGMCDRWRGKHGFLNFIEDVGDRPDGMTLDRKDVNGNYCKENCRWVTWDIQVANKRQKKDVGIYKRSNGSYYVHLGVRGIRYALGTYKKYEDAVNARKEGEKKYRIL